MELVIVDQPKWLTFGVPGGDPDLFREIIRNVYENILINNDDYVPELEWLFNQSETIELDIRQSITQLFTFGEIREYWGDEEEERLNDNSEWYGQDINNDIKLSLLLDRYFFVDENSNFVNNPLISIW